MRRNVYGPAVQVSILTVLLLCLEVYSEDTECSPIIKVRHNTISKAVLGRRFVIECPVELCNNSPPNLTWTQDLELITNNDSRIKIKWDTVKHLKGISRLIFEQVLLSDSGLYRCEVGGDVSHYITVNVSDITEHTTVAWPETINSTQSQEPALTDTLWLYAFCAGGTVLLVIFVIAVMLLTMQCCKGKSRKPKQSESAYTVIPMSQQPILPPNHPHPRGPDHIYDNAPYRAQAAASRTTVLGEEEEEEEEEAGGRGHGNREQARGREKAVARDGGEVTYASLNHQVLPPGRAARPPRPKEERSEYAAIRVLKAHTPPRTPHSRPRLYVEG